MVAELDQQPVMPVLIAIFAAIVVLLGSEGLIMILAALLMGWWLRHMMMSQLGGTTGDTAGALVEIVEATVLIVAVIRF